MFQKVLYLVLGLVAIYLVVVFAFYWLQTGLIHYPSTNLDTHPGEHDFEHEDVYIDSDESAKLHGWFIPHPNPRYTLVFYHGNAGNISDRIDSFKIFHDLGLSIFIYDYRSYGISTGELAEDKMYHDAETAWKYLTETRNVPPEKIIVFGRSLGGAMASWVASKHKPAGLIMESAFTSIPNMARLYYNWLPTQYMVRWYYNSLSRMDEVTSPVLFIHSRSDTLIPFAESQKLYEATQSRKEFLEIIGDHNDGFLQSGEIYTNGLDKFIRSLSNG